MKKIILFLMTIVLLFLTSCAERSTSNRIKYEENKRISISDISIAYVYNTDPYMQSDMLKLKKQLFLSDYQLKSYNVAQYESIQNTLNDIYAHGHNIVILESNIDQSSVIDAASSNPKIFYIYQTDKYESNFNNLITVSADYYQYGYVLGYITAKQYSQGKIAIYVDNVNSLNSYREVNSFALGSKIANPEIKIYVTNDIKTLNSLKSIIVYIPYFVKEIPTDINSEIIGFNKENSLLKTDWSLIIKNCIEDIISGSLNDLHITNGVKYDMCSDSIELLAKNDEDILQIVEKLKNGFDIFSQYSINISENNITVLTDSKKDSRGNTVIDENGNYFCYTSAEDDADLIICPSPDELVNIKMNYYLDNVFVK